MLFVLFCLFVGAFAAQSQDAKSVYFVVSPKPSGGADLAEVTSRLTQEGSDSGQYHVYLPDGSFQKAQYATAPHQSEEKVQNPFFLVSPVNIQDYQPNEQKRNLKVKKLSNYVASVQYTDVPPLQGPVYAYNPEPLVRIVRYAPKYL